MDGSFNLTAASILIPLCALGFYGIISLFLRSKATEPTTVNWTPLEAVSITIAVYIISQLVGGTIMGAALGAMGKSGDEINDLLSNSNIAQFFYVAIVEAFTAWVIIWFVRRRKTALKAIGIVRPKTIDVGYAFLALIVYFILYIAVLTVATKLVPGLNIDQKQDLGFSADNGGGALPLVFLSLVILPPLTEELLCRGFLFSGLRTKLTFVPAMLITSLLFASAHLQAGSGNALLWVAALDTFVLSLVLVFLREKTGSLWPGIFVHGAKNMIAFAVLFIFKAG